MKKIANYLKESGSNFANTFRRLDRTIFLVVVYDIVFFLSLAAVYRKYSSLMIKAAGPILEISIDDMTFVTKQAAQSYLSTLHMFYVRMALYAVLFFLIMVAIYALTNMLIWSAITSTDIRKQKPGFFIRYSILNLVWCAVWALLYVLVVWSVRTGVVGYWLVAMALLYGHITSLVYISFFRRKKAGSAVKSAFSAGFARLQHFIVPYILAALVFVLLNIIVMPFQRAYITQVTTVNFIIFLFYFAWLRIYIHSFAKGLV